jgi:formylglycine-generating enzyme required for sulfatase activity
VRVDEDIFRRMKTMKNIKMVEIPGGKFLMGGDKHDDEKPVHEVIVPSFRLGKYSVTNEEYGKFLEETGAKEPEYWGDRDFNQPRQPVVGVSWHDAKAFAEWAGGRLPSEAEWEYACRAGTTTKYYSGDSEEGLNRVGWCWENSGEKLHAVGGREPNAFGLYDMHGNVWEWVADDWHGDYDGAPRDGNAWVDDPRGGARVVRGGSWHYNPVHCRSASRDFCGPVNRLNDLGFRILLDPK